MLRRRDKSAPKQRDPRIGLDTISFDTFAWPLESDDGEARVWFGDDVLLSEHFFALPPDLTSMDSADLRDLYERLLAEAGGDGEDNRTSLILEIESDPTLPVVRTLFRLPLPDRYTFIGSLTVPLAECNWVIRLQAFEGSLTGVREALAFNQAHREHGDGSFEELLGSFDPYDRRWDGIVPGDPLTTVRKYLDRVQASVQCRPEFYDRTPFHGVSRFKR